MARFSSSAAMALANALGVDPSKIEGTGKGGKITTADVRKAATSTGSKVSATRSRRRRKPFDQLTSNAKLERALRHFRIKKSEVISHRVYPHKVAIVYGIGKKVEYWPDED